MGSDWSKLQAITRRTTALAWSTGEMGGSIGNAQLVVRRSRSALNCGGPSNVRSSAAESRWCCWTIWASIPRRGRGCCEQLLDELRGKLVLVYTPTYDPESNRIEWLWRSLRRVVTHTHQHATLPPLLEAADKWACELTSLQILRQIGSPFADPVDLPDRHTLAHAA